MVRAGLRAFLQTGQDFDVVGEAADAAEAVRQYTALKPDVTLMDLRLPDRTGLDATREILSISPGARVIVVTTYMGDAHIHNALEAGAAAYLLKDMLRQEVADAIRMVHGGRKFVAARAAQSLAEGTPRVHLSERETTVLEFVAKGMRNREIASLIGTTEETVKMHLKRIFEKLEATDRTEAVTIAARRGFLDLR